MNGVFKIISIFLLLLTQLVNAQFFHVHANNTDNPVRQKLMEYNGLVIARTAAIGYQNQMLKEMRDAMKKKLEMEYTENDFDNDEDYTKVILGSTFNVGVEMAGRFSKLPYYTNTKKNHLQAMALQKAILFFIQKPNATNITRFQREQIHLLRKKLLKSYSKQDIKAMGIMALPALAKLIQDDKVLLRLIQGVDFIL